MNKHNLWVLIFTTSIASTSVQADGWFLRPVVGMSLMSDTSVNATNVDSVTGYANVDLDSGFNAGLGIGYQYSANWAAEIYWEYRTNDSSVDLAGQSNFDGGNYASNIFYLNGFYYLRPEAKWKTYLGLGLGWVQEIDIDLQRDGTEQSYSGDGDVTWQVFLGTEREITDNLSFQAELRHGEVSGIDLQGESAPGAFSDLDYNTTTLQIGLRYSF